MLKSQWLIGSGSAGAPVAGGRGTKGAAPLRLFCFPYAGGGASIYRTWGEGLSSLADVYAVQLPGREERMGHPRYYSIPRLVRAILDAQRDWFDSPFVLFGHSMGAKIVFELAGRLCERGQCPRMIICSASRPPCFPSPRRIHELPDNLFTEELRHLAGTPEAILRDRDFMDMYRPILRADFTMDETYENGEVLDVPLVVIGGEQDTETDREALSAWRRLTRGPFSLHVLEGDHFFIRHRTPALLDVVRSELSRVV